MTYFLITFVIMLIYGSVVALLAYKAGKSSKRLVKALNLSGNAIYIDTSKIESVLIDENVGDGESAGVVVNFGSHTRLRCRLSGNPWVTSFIKGASE